MIKGKRNLKNKMEEKKEDKPLCNIGIGDILISAPELNNCEQMLNKVLKNKDVKRYLNNYNKQKIARSMGYVG